MALTSIDIEQYVKLASNVKHLSHRDFYLSYDAEADVAYINFHNPAKSANDSELTDDDVIVRYDEHRRNYWANHSACEFAALTSSPVISPKRLWSAGLNSYLTVEKSASGPREKPNKVGRALVGQPTRLDLS